MPWTQVGGVDIHYLDEGEGTPLVFLHGFMSCAEAWFQQFEHFGDRYRVIAYDSVNHGMSGNSPRDEPEPDRVDELDGLLAALDLERPVLLGNSMGAGTLLRWAARHPDRAAALVPSGSGVAAPGTRGAAPRLREPIPESVLLLPIGDALTDRFRTGQKLLYDRYVRMRSTATSVENRRHPRRPAAATVADRETVADRVAAIRSPMLVVVGSLDRAVPRAEALHKRVAGSEYVLIDGAPHNVYYEAAEPYNAAVEDFLGRVLGG